MTRNNADFKSGRFPIPYNGEPLFHGTRQTFSVGDVIPLSPAEEHKGINVPVGWTTTSPIDAAHYGKEDEGTSPVNVYTVTPINPESVRGTTSGIMHPGERKINTHFVSARSFAVTGVHHD